MDGLRLFGEVTCPQALAHGGDIVDLYNKGSNDDVSILR
jgi:hypothetical protein